MHMYMYPDSNIEGQDTHLGPVVNSTAHMNLNEIKDY